MDKQELLQLIKLIKESTKSIINKEESTSPVAEGKTAISE